MEDKKDQGATAVVISMDRLQAHSELQQYRVEHANTQRETETEETSRTGHGLLSQAVNLPSGLRLLPLSPGRERRGREGRDALVVINYYPAHSTPDFVCCPACDGWSNHNLYY